MLGQGPLSGVFFATAGGSSFFLKFMPARCQTCRHGNKSLPYVCCPMIKKSYSNGAQTPSHRSSTHGEIPVGADVNVGFTVGGMSCYIVTLVTLPAAGPMPVPYRRYSPYFATFTMYQINRFTSPTTFSGLGFTVYGLWFMVYGLGALVV
jgi:hypothetical protein